MNNDGLRYDVIVVGAGNAALCAAIAAKQNGASVLVLEKAPFADRGGNSCLTLNMRFAYNSIDDIQLLVDELSNEDIKAIQRDAPSYPEKRFLADLLKVTDGKTDLELAHIVVEKSFETMKWLHSLGQRWIYESSPFANSLYFYMKGGGFSHQQRAFSIARNIGVNIVYNSAAQELILNQNKEVKGVIVNTGNKYVQYECKAVILACGGFEANSNMRAEYLGRAWENVKIRGVPYNSGDGIQMALRIGAQKYGSWLTCHASPQDISLPNYTLPKDYETRKLFDRYYYPFGITVNKNGKRFFDEGETSRNLTYAKFGRAILAQPGSVAFQIFDSKTEYLFGNQYRLATSFKANSIKRLANALEIDRENLSETIDTYNKSVRSQNFKPEILDGNAAIGIIPPKSNWAIEINAPPYYAYPVICGLTFTFGGIRINRNTEVLNSKSMPIIGLFAAGEIVGGLFHNNYPGGTGMMAGAVFGRIAGRNAALLAKAIE